MPRLKQIGLLAVLAATLALAGSAGAVSYIGGGGGPAFSLGSEAIRTFYVYNETSLEYEVSSYDTTTFGRGWGLEAQFGWELAPWVDAEGAMRYHRLPASGDSSTAESRLTRTEMVGFEGGLRIHLRRVITNSTPYIRFGLGSYSPSFKETSNTGTLSNDATLGYYVGVGYMHEISGKTGLDIRATVVVYDQDDGTYIRMRATKLSIVASLLIF